MTLVPARLEGGPFDGNDGGLDVPGRARLPLELWTCRCSAAASAEFGTRPARCAYNPGCDGVHWWVERSLADEDPDRHGVVERYILARLQHDEILAENVAVYVYGELAEDDIARFERVPAPPVAT